MPYPWPAGFERVPGDEWTRQPIDDFARRYDEVDGHTWYRNLDPTVAELKRFLQDGHVLVDYSGGTGILARRLLRAVDREYGVVIVDASAKFLRLALETLREESRAAFRLLRVEKERGSVQPLDLALGPVLGEGEVDALVCTNAIHLYPELGETLAGWRRAVRPDARVFVQSGNIDNPAAPPGAWIIDETIDAIRERAVALVRRKERYAPDREVLDDPERWTAYRRLKERYFLPVRPLSAYVAGLEAAGFAIVNVSISRVEALVSEWHRFLSVYDEGILGWVGGSERIEGRRPAEEALSRRRELLAEAIGEVFAGRDRFDCCWTHLVCRPRPL